MRIGKLPEYNNVTPKQIYAGVLKRSIEFEFEFESLINKMNSNFY